MATYIKTVDPNGGADYTSISAWEAGEQSLYTSGDIAIADCRRNGSAKDTAAVVISGWTAGVTPKIIVNAAYRHDGTVAGGGYELSPTTNVTFLTISTPNTVVDGLKMQGSTAQSYKSAIAGTSGQTNGVIICNCLIYDYGKTTNDWNDAIYLSGGANTFGGGRCYNNIIIARSGLYARGRGGIACETPYSEGSVYNNTVYGFLGTNNYGIKVQGDSGHIVGICKNNVSINNAIDFIATYARDCDNNVSSDATAPGTTKATGQTAYTDYFVSPGTGDFHLKGASATLWGISGADLSGTFTVDIDGQTRSAPWDIGADQYVATGGTPGTATPAGVSGTASAGTATAKGRGAASPAGRSATATVGTAAAKGRGKAATAGMATSSAVGTAAAKARGTVTAAGVASSAATGTATATGKGKAAPSGVSATAAVGVATASHVGGSIAYPAGTSVSAAVGTVTGKGKAAIAPVGVSAVSMVGAATGGGKAAATITGISAATGVGAVSGRGRAIALPGGVVVVTAAGTAISTGRARIAVTGVASSAAVGTATAGHRGAIPMEFTATVVDLSPVAVVTIPVLFRASVRDTSPVCRVEV